MAKKTHKKQTKQATNRHSIVRALAFPLLTLSVGSLGSVVTTSAIPSWYVYLNKPAFTPPNWLFGPVWTVLYILMGIAAYRIWLKGAAAKGAMTLFVFQFALNVIWSFLFFGLKSTALGLFGIAALWIVLLETIITFYRYDRVAAYLLIPYFVWGTFASYLAIMLFILN